MTSLGLSLLILEGDQYRYDSETDTWVQKATVMVLLARARNCSIQETKRHNGIEMPMGNSTEIISGAVDHGKHQFPGTRNQEVVGLQTRNDVGVRTSVFSRGQRQSR